MTVASTSSPAARLIESFSTAPPDRLDDEFGRLVGALWRDGTAREVAAAAVPVLIRGLDQVDDDRRGRLAVLLGLLAEAEHEGVDGGLATAVRAGIDRYLALWRDTTPGQPLCLSLQYLLAHFPQERDAILDVAAGLDLEPNERSLFERALDRLDPAHPAIGRVFPSPYVWRLMDDLERDFDQSWIGRLTPEQVRQNWDNDTRTVLGHCGAKAYWAVRNGTPEPVVTPPLDRELLGRPPRDLDPGAFARHAESLRCPGCGDGLSFAPGAARCAGCGAEYPIARGILDLSGGDRAAGGDFLYKLAEVPTMGLFYEAYARPAFLRISGSNWGGQVTLADEDRYLAEKVQPVAGPVVDLGAGAGRWTGVLAEAVGADRVIALDLYPPMLAALRARVPAVPAVMANARTLPFADASIGAVLCWNALQAFPADARAVIAEVGRCLRPGGTFSVLTFRMSDDPVYRYFQSRHHLPGHPNGLRLFELDELRSWLTEAGMTVWSQSLPGTFVLLTAERTA